VNAGDNQPKSGEASAKVVSTGSDAAQAVTEKAEEKAEAPAKADDTPKAETIAPESEEGPQTTAPVRRGKGFGTKNLAAMRARSSPKPGDPPSDVADVSGKDIESDGTPANDQTAGSAEKAATTTNNDQRKVNEQKSGQ
jgi:hypothetical protein